MEKPNITTGQQFSATGRYMSSERSSDRFSTEPSLLTPLKWKSFPLLFFCAILASVCISCRSKEISATENEQAGSKNQQRASAGDITLPAPESQTDSFLKIVTKRETSRSFSDKTLSLQKVSNVLYAAFGINRPDKGKRTAPSAHDWQYVDVYVSDANGLYLFDAGERKLKEILKGDIRSLTGTQSYPAKAPLNLVYVVDYSKMGSGNVPRETAQIFGSATVGAIMQNVYLYAASSNMAAGVRADIDRPRLRKTMKLNKSQSIILAQSFGYPQ
ncbi:MAG: nitroreductase family protein [Deltaproteobacteria bacterium]|nr:nitroreductase family protein [Deltaproteobacteria bacterium]